ncbi:hypothetical protein NDU88_003661 [Pleurodeles waltl]|uniref:Uncharacterized protein n=1 Tax=Pleurodeles waltl TaxID=8319 RepID=A0AAV7VGL8_PLEWA|nr:hypothetical protein NDU88_003661 [Pleurodeles waltl]
MMLSYGVALPLCGHGNALQCSFGSRCQASGSHECAIVLRRCDLRRQSQRSSLTEARRATASGGLEVGVPGGEAWLGGPSARRPWWIHGVRLGHAGVAVIRGGGGGPGVWPRREDGAQGGPETAVVRSVCIGGH